MTSSPSRPGPNIVSLFLYSFAGGYADAGGYLVAHSFTGHVTGNLVLFVIAAAGQDLTAMAHTAAAVVTFLAATAIGQAILARSKGSLSLRLVCFITGIQATFIGASAFIALHAGRYGALAMVACLCCALGLQNGLVNSIDGVSVHTTYLTGTITSLLNQAVNLKTGEQPINRQLRLIRSQALVWTAFMVGALAAALLIHREGPIAILGLEVSIILSGILRVTHYQDHSPL